MEYQNKNGVICIGEFMNAALYFDYIVPVDFSIYCYLNKIKENKSTDGSCFSCNHGVSPDKILTSLFSFSNFNYPCDDALFRKYDSIFHKITEYLAFLLAIRIKSQDIDYDRFKKIVKKNSNYPKKTIQLLYSYLPYISKNENNVSLHCHNFSEFLSIAYVENMKFDKKLYCRDMVKKISNLFGIKNMPVILPHVIDSADATDDDMTLTLSKIQLIDISKACWEQIIELRKDSESMKKIRNLRLFLHSNYKDKNRAFIEDDINKRLDQYSKACKDHGFETITSSISAVFNSKNLQTTVAASVAAAVLGEPIVVAGTILSGLCIEIGKFALTLSKKQHAFNKLKNDHDLAYIIEAKNRLEK